VADAGALNSVLAPGVALTSVVIYWANLQSRLDTIAQRVRSLNAELRTEVDGSERASSVQRQVEMLFRRTRALHLAVLLSIVALIGFLASSAILFIVEGPDPRARWVAAGLFILGLATFGASLVAMFWEILWARLSLEEDVRSSHPRRTDQRL
jgi:Protein of unknown function (DUF2721)